MIEQDTIDSMINFFKTNLNMLPLGKETNAVKLIDNKKLFTFVFDVENQHTRINFYMLPLQDYSPKILNFPLYMETITVNYLDKQEQEIGQEILDSIGNFDFSKEKLMNKITETVNINNPNQEE